MKKFHLQSLRGVEIYTEGVGFHKRIASILIRKLECEKIADEKIDDVINIAFFTPIAKCLCNLQNFILYKEMTGAWEYIFTNITRRANRAK